MEPAEPVVEDRDAAEAERQAWEQRMAEEWAAKLAEVDRVLRQAHQRAEELAEQARAEGHQQGYTEGYEQGYNEGLAIARRALDEEIAQVRAIAQGAMQARQEMLQRLEGEIVSLALAIAEKVIGEEARRSEAVVAHVVRRAVQYLGRRGPYRIRVNPLDAERLRERWQALDELEGASWELIPDERIAVGGCILESGASLVDAQLDAQFERIRKRLQGDQGPEPAEELADGLGD